MLISHPMIKGLVSSISLGSTMWMSGKWDDQHFFTTFSRGGENWGLGTCTDTDTQHSWELQTIHTLQTMLMRQNNAVEAKVCIAVHPGWGLFCIQSYLEWYHLSIGILIHSYTPTWLMFLSKLYAHSPNAFLSVEQQVHVTLNMLRWRPLLY